jgi:hypothetical protein
MKGCTSCKYTSAAPKKELNNQDFLERTRIFGFKECQEK